MTVVGRFEDGGVEARFCFGPVSTLLTSAAPTWFLGVGLLAFFPVLV